MAGCISLSDSSSYRDILSDVDEWDDNNNSSAPIGVVIQNFSGQKTLDNKEIAGNQLLLALQNMPTLECVTLIDMMGVIADAFIMAAVQNESIHTVEIQDVSCSADVVRALLKRKRRVCFSNCSIYSSDPQGFVAATADGKSTDSYACNVEELEIRSNSVSRTMTEVLGMIRAKMSFSVLRKLSLIYCRSDFDNELWDSNLVCNGSDADDSWNRLTNLFQVAPLLEELQMEGFCFSGPLILETIAMNVNHAPCPRLTYSFINCGFNARAAAILGDIVGRENAKLSRLCIDPSRISNVHELLRNVLQSNSCVTELAYWTYSWNQWDHSGDDHGLKYILQALEGRLKQVSCPVTTIELFLDKDVPNLYHNLIQSLPHWTPMVKCLRLGCREKTSHGYSNNIFPDDAIHSKFLQGVRENFHLQDIDLIVGDLQDNDHDDWEKSRTLLHLYGERNRKFGNVVNNPYTLPVHLWPYMLHIAGRAGPDSVYQFLRQSAI